MIEDDADRLLQKAVLYEQLATRNTDARAVEVLQAVALDYRMRAERFRQDSRQTDHNKQF
jgi:hypothetical protein